MIAFKSCPRCRGDLRMGADNEFSCLQCGYELPESRKRELVVRLQSRNRERLRLAA